MPRPSLLCLVWNADAVGRLWGILTVLTIGVLSTVGLSHFNAMRVPARRVGDSGRRCPKQRPAIPQRPITTLCRPAWYGQGQGQMTSSEGPMSSGMAWRWACPHPA